MLETLGIKIRTIELEFVPFSPSTPEKVANCHDPELLEGRRQPRGESVGEKQLYINIQRHVQIEQVKEPNP